MNQFSYEFNGTILGLFFTLFSSFQYVQLCNTVDSKLYRRWLDSNRGSLVSDLITVKKLFLSLKRRKINGNEVRDGKSQYFFYKKLTQSRTCLNILNALNPIYQIYPLYQIYRETLISSGQLRREKERESYWDVIVQSLYQWSIRNRDHGFHNPLSLSLSLSLSHTHTHTHTQPSLTLLHPHTQTHPHPHTHAHGWHFNWQQ